MIEKEKYIVQPNVKNVRLSDYLVGKMKLLPSRKSVKKAIKAGLVLVNGEVGTTGQWLYPYETITLIEKDERLKKVFEWRLEVIYEDEYLAIINKPAGLSVSGNHFRTIENALPFNLKTSTLPDAIQRFRAVHRLDALTSGLLLIAKTKTARIKLGNLFEQKKIEKTYQAIVIGQLPDQSTIDQAIEQKAALTHFKTQKIVRSLRNDYLSLVNLYPKTGRTHQLRIHLSNLGFPILGDKLYGKDGKIMKGKGLFLCATQLSFQHPFSHKILNIRIKPPNKFQLLLEREQKRWDNYDFEIKSNT